MKTTVVCRRKNQKGMCVRKSSCYHIRFVARREKRKERSAFNLLT